ncbi:MAG: dihydrodipicolinate synthase family protein [Rubrobacteraceae bacterium]
MEGVYVANVTPFREDATFSLDVEAYVGHVAWLAERGMRGVVPFGTNGEGTSVSVEEKLGALGRLFSEGLEVEVIPTVAEGNLPDTLRMLEGLEGLPATAVLALPPYYIKPVSDEGLRKFYEAAIEVTRHPVIVYHIPKYAVPVPAEVVMDLPVWGVKDSGGEEGYAEALLRNGRGVLIGTEDDLWERLGLGAEGIISALANFIPEQMVEMHRLAKKGDEHNGRELSKRLQEVRAATKAYAAPGVLKRLAGARHGIDLGTVRPPLMPPPPEYDPERVLRLASVAS